MRITGGRRHAQCERVGAIRISRRDFLRKAGMAAVGGVAVLAGGGLMRGAGADQNKFKIGLMTSLTGWPGGGEPSMQILRYAVERQGEVLGVPFEVLEGDSSCGIDPVTAFDNLKSQGVDFFIGPTCSASVQLLLTGPAPSKQTWKEYKNYIRRWRTTSMLSPGANSSSIEQWSQEQADLIDPEGPLHFRTLTFEAAISGRYLGELACSENLYVGMITENDAFAQSLANGARQACSGLVYDNAQVDMTDIQAIEAVIYEAINAGAASLIMIPFGTSGAENIATALESSTFTGQLYGSFGFLGVDLQNATALDGMYVVDVKSDESLETQAWQDYKNDMNNEIPGVIADFQNAWGSEFWLMSHVDTTQIMTGIIARENGNVKKVNRALENEILYQADYGTFLGDIKWDGMSFPTTANGDPIIGPTVYQAVGGNFVLQA